MAAALGRSAPETDLAGRSICRRRASGRRIAALAGLGIGLLLLHLVGVDRWLREHPIGDARAPAIRRIDVSFVRELEPASPPVVAVKPRPPVARRASRGPREPVAAVSKSASAAEAVPAASMPIATPPVDPLARADDLGVDVPGGVKRPVPEPPADEPVRTAPPGLAASAPGGGEERAADRAAGAEPTPPMAEDAVAAASEAAASAPVAFEWPASTRLSYRLTGHYRGPVEGQAQVDWLRQGARYQVHLEVSIGPFFAPLIARRMSSQGALTPDGLLPQLYEEETRIALRDPRRVLMRFDGTQLTLANGDRVVQPSGVQDTASQFVQMTWLFTTRPDLLTPGRTVGLPLALPRHVDRWFYDVTEQQTLYTPFGPVPTMHVKPRRAPRPGGDLVAEAWFAPTLQYLPVRIVIRQDAETYVDLMIERLPQQAEAEAPR